MNADVDADVTADTIAGSNASLRCGLAMIGERGQDIGRAELRAVWF